MADNTILNTGAGGDTIRDLEKGGSKTQVVLLDIGGAGAEALFTGAVTITSGTVSVTGVATAANQATEIASLSSIDSRLAGTLTISGAVTQSGAWTTGRTWTLSSGTDSVAVTGTITANAGTNLNTSLLALEAGGNLASVKTNTDPLVASAAGGYVRQDSTATIAKETGGNLATIATNTGRIPAQGAAATAASLPVNIASDQTVPVSNASLITIAAAIKTEDSASADGDSGIQSLGVRQDIPATDTSLSGDYAPFKTDNKGRVWVASDLLDALLRSQNDALLAILTEMRVQNYVLQTGLNVREELDGLRQDAYFNASLQ